MKHRNIYLGDTLLQNDNHSVEGQFVEIQNEKFYKISNYNQMSDFFMTIVSDSDHWMFISSNGSLSAGRKNRNNALFPYYTDDKIHDYRHLTGSNTLVLVTKNDKTYLWEPFSQKLEKVYSIQRNLYKSIYGNKLLFEEINLDLGVSFQYGWYNSEKFGFVKKSSLLNQSGAPLTVQFVDGIQNILPNGIDYNFQNEYSNLLDAYKKNERLEDSSLGLYLLSSIPVDRAEPSESLKATSVWSAGLSVDATILLSNKQLENFKKGIALINEIDVRATRGAYYVNAEITLPEKASQEWMIVAEINQDSVDVANLHHFLQSQKNTIAQVNKDIEEGTKNLIKIVANADGLQVGNDDLSRARHFSNTMFNVMRGGIFTNNYTLDVADFKLFVAQINKNIAIELDVWLNALPQSITYAELQKEVEKMGMPNLERITYEYLPLTFSRRHGDPSRPWNQFAIETKNADGTPKSDFQGNWRDIFQNWEALSISYPEFIEGMMSKFVNASTADGYNPYRITRKGIDWECPDPEDPWAYIGYWGDHQIIYLEKFLELSQQYHPGKLEQLLTKDIFAYANVPYRLKAYTEMVKNPQDTIGFDFELNDKIKELEKELGADARLVQLNNEVYRVNFTEKILATLLSKLSNFIPEAGIWLNTQRPEWNDANNALVGNGVSMVTLYYIRRFLKFWFTTFSKTGLKEASVSAEIKELFDAIFAVFHNNTSLLQNGFSDTQRRTFADALGEAGTAYRNSIYAQSFSGKKEAITVNALAQFVEVALQYIDQSIKVNQRKDGLFHAYNLIAFKDDKITVRYLYEMLEGQVAVLSSGYLSTLQSLDVMDALKASKLFREDQYSYILYPDRNLPRFTEKNNIPLEHIESLKLLKALVENGDRTILSGDDTGRFHFDGAFRNASVLDQALNQLDAEKYATLVHDKQKVLDIYEEMFDHQSFTGRSGTFYGYEGLGSIYWHMVSKLLLAVQECYFKAENEGADAAVLGRIMDHYYEIKAGIGLSKSPQLYGAFPTDAYSHTPGNAGAKQPGMTGQVKEDFISRMLELGVRVQNGTVMFNASMLNRKELLVEAAQFEYFDLKGEKQILSLKPWQLAFTFCQVPVVYSPNLSYAMKVTLRNGEVKYLPSNKMSEDLSASIFKRTGEVVAVEVSI